MIKAKTPAEIEKLRIGGQKLARILRMTAEQVKPGVDTKFLNDFAHDLIIKENCGSTLDLPTKDLIKELKKYKLFYLLNEYNSNKNLYVDVNGNVIERNGDGNGDE
jgi:hypothetical protein